MNSTNVYYNFECHSVTSNMENLLKRNSLQLGHCITATNWVHQQSSYRAALARNIQKLIPIKGIFYWCSCFKMILWILSTIKCWNTTEADPYSTRNGTEGMNVGIESRNYYYKVWRFGTASHYTIHVSMIHQEWIKLHGNNKHESMKCMKYSFRQLNI